MSDIVDDLNAQERAYFESRGESGLPEEQALQVDVAQAFEAGEQAGGTMEKGVAQGEEPEQAHFSRTVPHGALHAEREEHKKTRAQLNQLREEATRMQKALEAIVATRENGVTAGIAVEQGMEGEAAHSATPPDPREDFLGFTRWQVNEINRLKAHMAEEKQREIAQQQQTEAEQALWGEWSRSVQETKAEVPDLETALNYLADMRDRQLSALGKVDARFQNPALRAQQMQAELRDLVAASLRGGTNPAKSIYEVARGYGYGAQGGERFKELNAAQTAARTLAASSGRDAGDPMLLETVANLSEGEFAKWYENNRDTFRKMFGG